MHFRKNNEASISTVVVVSLPLTNIGPRCSSNLYMIQSFLVFFLKLKTFQ